MLKAYKYRIYPNEEQKVLIHKHLGCTRWIYNYALAKKTKTYQETGKGLSRFDIQKDLPILKKQEETEWLKEVNSQSLQYSLENLDNAFTKFFKKQGSYPQFKSKKRPKNSFGIPQSTTVDFEEAMIYLPKFKSGIKTIIHRRFEGEIRSSTVSKTSTGKYYISILVQSNDSIPKKPSICENKAIGIDLGIKSFLVTSEGLVVDNPKHLKKSLRRLKIRQRKLSKKQKDSNNRKKSVRIVSFTHEKISNKRNDFLHKLSKELVINNDTICLETLRVANMIKNHCLAQAIADASWSEFNRMINYKAEWYGCNILRCGTFEPSSKMCSCGHINNDLKLSDREWTCPKCSKHHLRDHLAATNIKKFCFVKNNTSGTEEIYASRDMISVTRSTQEATKSLV